MKKGLSKIISVFLVILMLIGSAPLSGFMETDWSDFKFKLPSLFTTEASAASYSGQCGENVHWSLDAETGVLKIIGSGDMNNYSSSNDAPWYEYKDYIKSVNISNSITSIGDEAFNGCTSLTNVKIPDGVTSIGNSAFSYCTSLANIIIPDSVTSIGEFVFYCCKRLANISISDSIKSISGYTFYYCTRLTNIEIPDSVTSICSNAFSCTGLKSIIIPNSVTIIGDCAFYRCNGLTSVTIGNSVTTIDCSAFYLCSSLTSIIIPNSVTHIGGCAFYSCKGLKDVYYSGTEEQWKKIDKSYYNGYLLGANIYYNCRSGCVNNYTTLIIEPRNIQSIAGYTTGDDNLSFIKGGDNVNLKLGNVSLKIGNTSFSQLKDKTFAIPLDDITDDIVLSRDGFYNYIIPKEVAKSFYSSKNNYMLTAWMSKDELSGKRPYISSVFAKVEGSDTNFVDIRYDPLSVKEDENCEIYISAGNISGNTSYVLSQDDNHKISKNTRAFSDSLENLSSAKSSVVYVKDKNGTSKAVSVNLSKERQNKDVIESINSIFKDGKLSAGGNNGLKLTLPKDWPFIGGSTLNLLDFEFPVAFDISADGTARLSIGFDWTKQNTTSYSYSTIDKETGQEHPMAFSDVKTSTNWDKSVWENLKKDIRDASSFKNAKDKKAALKAKNNLLKRYGMSANDLASGRKRGFDFGVSALGFAEGKLIEGKFVFTEFQVSIAGVVTISFKHQSTGWYACLEGSGNLKVAADWNRETADTELPLDFNVSVSSEPYVKLSGGAGVKGIISAGLYGKATLPFVIEFKNGHISISITGEFGGEAEVLFFKTGEISILSGTLGPFETYIWGSKSYMAVPNKIASLKGFRPAKADSLEITGVTERDSSKWVGSSAPKKTKALISQQPKTMDVKNLQTDVYKESGVRTVT
ncbi:MAG: leucine-rich repeat protein, partial [Acutalibacteraceae bacterium]